MFTSKTSLLLLTLVGDVVRRKSEINPDAVRIGTGLGSGTGLGGDRNKKMMPVRSEQRPCRTRGVPLGHGCKPGESGQEFQGIYGCGQAVGEVATLRWLDMRQNHLSSIRVKSLWLQLGRRQVGLSHAIFT
jgi:hypothetical protein